ncbi:unnamed protein product [Rotaria sordida]|uniref:Uncharacterized protein n=1 Tax=Rotaria sordida TaxID=392033 RepID=A0A813WG93_9BILA|nr:unnamed protein product [Rotaria sordida]CAF3866101.1 unnamed protein product [Rotaria sordida]
MCFRYFGFYHTYDTFYCLNQRFKQLIQYETKSYIDLYSTPSGKFLTFCFDLIQLIKTSQNYPLSIVALDKYRFNLIFYDDLFKDKFSKVKSLTLLNIDARAVYSIIFDDAIKLYQSLERLSLLNKIGEENEHSNDIKYLCSHLISSKMKSLKYLNLNFKRYSCACEHGLYRHTHHVELEFYELTIGNKSLSNLETLIIGNIPCGYGTYTSTELSFNTFTEKLSPCLSKLKNLMINAIRFDEDKYPGQNGVCIKILSH